MSETQFVTFGCRLNTYESEVMRKHAETAGIRGEYLKSIADVEQKAVSLAEATPAKKFA